jgi:hypothetical protein
MVYIVVRVTFWVNDFVDDVIAYCRSVGSAPFLPDIIILCLQ